MAPTLTTWVKTVRERLSRKGQLDKILDSFKKCMTDEERVACLYNIEDVHEVLNVKETYKAKDEDEAKDLRIQGNLAFQKKDYDAALKLYSDCIINAPSKGSTELALALGNRSAVLYHLHNYVLCLQDIRQAFKHSYPDHLQYKLYERRGKACYALRLKEEAICAFNDSLNVLDKTQLDQKKVATLKSDLMKQLEKCNKIVPGGKFKNVRDYNHNHTQIPEFKESRSSHIPCMVNSLVMKSTDGHGRGLYATRDIEVGEVLIIEKPFTSVTLREYNLTHCHHCCNKVYCPLPCDQCSGVVFCSEECLDTAMKSYHYAECKYHDLIQRSELGMAHLALRMVLKVGQKFLREYQKKAEEKMSDPLLLGCNENGVYDSDDYHSVYNLVNHTDDRSCPDLFRRALGAVFLVKCIEKSEFFAAAEGAEDSDVDEESVYVGGHILRHTQMLPCNAHEVSELLYKTYSVEMSEPVEIGSAIYSTLSLINHSCDPSVVRHLYGNQCVVRAIRNISKGEEIFDNYGVLYPVTSKQMRQEKLVAQYYFTCNCYACVSNWPMYNKIRREDPVLKCKKCKIGRVRIPADNHTTRAICSDCREVMDITPDLLHLSKSEQFFQGSMDKVLKGEDRDAALPFLVDHLKLIDTLLFRPWKDYNDCQEAIKQCYGSMGNCHVVEEPDEDDEELMMGQRRNLRPT
ncbi:SET and MYND domain-containing protein 4-like [Haliotis rubra]|uniref:SET and MYND domain-containing protein 4-like n=1 Tax=Haliotis rubra TaxID=36100 RepID=UPI001EE59C0E|nr:SET and MYND domain-containing protein 4-like [Haliotis rubra]